MVGAHQNLNGSRHLTTPILGTVCRPFIRKLALAMVNLSAKFEASISTHYEDIKGDRKCRNCGGLG